MSACHAQSAGLQLQRPVSTPHLHILPFHDHPEGEPSQLPDRANVAWTLKQNTKDAIILLYAPELDPNLQKITGLVN